MTMLKFARDLAAFQSHLEWAAHGGGGGDSIAASYLHLLGELDELDEYVDILEGIAGDAATGRVGGILAGAIGIFEQHRAEASDAARAAEARLEAQHAEAVRRHQLAVTVECPYCGAAPGLVCRTAGPSGKSYPKGVHDHRDRLRAVGQT